MVLGTGSPSKNEADPITPALTVSVSDPNFGWNWSSLNDRPGVHQRSLPTQARPLTLVLHGRWNKSPAVKLQVAKHSRVGSAKSSRGGSRANSRPATAASKALVPEIKVVQTPEQSQTMVIFFLENGLTESIELTPVPQ